MLRAPAHLRDRLGRRSCRAWGALFAWGVAWCVAGSSPAAEPASPTVERHAAEQFFERSIRPLFIEHCSKCHSGEKHKGGLRLDSRAGVLQGGDSGPAVVVGQPEASLLVKAMRWSDDTVQMPPDRRLPDKLVNDVRTWIAQGAVWPGGDAAAGVDTSRGKKEVTEADRRAWPYHPIRRPALPEVRDRAWVVNPIDAFILSKLEARGLSPNPPASRSVLVRRVTFDLHGLPPDPEERAEFPALVDRLLASPAYGERWARHWLDVVRYGQSNGYERDNDKPFAWRYRDYVIRSLNDDKPYDRFVLEQLAGDELDDPSDDSRIATGFYRLGVWDDEPDDARAAEFDDLDDVMVASGAAFMGLTLGCARCHDHRFDPLLQSDYYGLLSFFRGVRRYENPSFDNRSPGIIPLGDVAAVSARFAAVEEQQKGLREQAKSLPAGDERKQLEAEIDRLGREAGQGVEWALGVREGNVPRTHVLIRGNAGTPGAEVEPHFPRVLGGETPRVEPRPGASSSGRRLALARWLTSPDHPLLARVIVNRVWHHHFGRGIVRTTSDFGRGGTPPTHPELLDWLAVELIESGWSLKHLHRVILGSRTYQMSSSTENDTARELDPANDLFWRQNLRRIEAESLRDAVLATSGQLNRAAGGPGFYPHLAGEVLAGGSRPGSGWQVSPADQQARRSIYAFIKRSLLVPVFEGFDYATNASPLSERPVTTVAPQALWLLNDEFMQQQSEAFAARLEREAGDDPQRRIRRAFALALNRAPRDEELAVAREYLARQASAYESLAGRLSFAPNVPLALHNSYSRQLQPRDYVRGPRTGWTFHRGQFRDRGGVAIVEVDQGPFALAEIEPFERGTWRLGVILQPAVESAGLLFRGGAAGDAYRGYELRFDPRGQRVSLRRHAGAWNDLESRPWPITPGQRLAVELDFSGDSVRVVLDGQPVFDVVDPQPLPARGTVGVRTWGAAVHVEQSRLTLTGAGATSVVTFEPAERVSPERQAWGALALLLLNLNEFVYLD